MKSSKNQLLQMLKATLVVLAAWVAAPVVHAQSTYIWNLDANGAWDTTAMNWTGAGSTYVSAPQNTAAFGGVITANRTITVDAGGVTGGVIRFEDLAALAYTIQTGPITLNNLGTSQILVQNGVRAAQTISSPITFADNLFINNNGAFANNSLTLSGAVNRSAVGGQVIVGGQANTTISGAIGANVAGGLTKTGTGVLVLNNASNAFTGNVNITGGVVSVSADTHLGNAANLVNFGAAGGGVLRSIATFTSARDFSTIAGAGTIDANSGTLTLNGNLTGSNALRIAASTATGTGVALQGANTGFTGAIRVGGPSELIGSSFVNRPFSTTNGATLTLSGAAGAISNASSLTIENGAALTITQPATAVTGRLGTIPLTFNGGRFLYTASANGGTQINETMGDVSVTGLMTIQGSATAGPATGTVLNFGTLTRNHNATLMFRAPQSGTQGTFGGPFAATSTQMFFSNLVPDTITSGTTRSVVPWAGNIITQIGTDAQNFMTYDANGFRPLNTTSEVVTISTLNTLATVAAGSNVRMTGGTTQTIAAGGQTINSLSSSSTMTITAASPTDTLTVTSGALSSFNTITINNGTFNFPNGAYFHLGFPWAFTGTSSISGANGVVVSSLNSSTSFQLRLTNTVANTFTGGLYINGNAQVTFQNNNHLGQDGMGNNAGQIVLGGGQLLFNPASATTVSLNDGINNRPIFVTSANGTIGTQVANAVLQVPGLISGPGQMQFGGGASTSATGVVELTGGANTYTGGTVIGTGILSITNPNQLGTGQVFLNGGTLRAAVGPMNFNLPTYVSSASTIDTGANNVTFSVPFNGTANITKTGTGILTFNNAGNYSGNITMANNQGHVAINGNGRLTDLGAVTIGANSSLTIDDSSAVIPFRTGRATNISFTNSAAIAAGGSLNLITNAAGSTFRFGTLAVTGGSAGNVNSSTITILDGGAGNHTVQFTSLTAIAANNVLNFVGSTNFGSTSPGGSRIFFNTAPALTMGAIANSTFTGFGGTGQATYDGQLGVILFVPPVPESGNLIDNVNAPFTSLNSLFTTTGDTTANMGARINSLTLDVGTGVNLVQLYGPVSANGNTPIDTLRLNGGNLTAQNGAKSITATTTGIVTFGANPANITTTSNLTIGNGVTLSTALGLTKNGAGTLTFDTGSTNAITGPYNIAAGNVVFNGDVNASGLTSAAGTNIAVPAGATFTTNQAGASTAAGNILGANGALTKQGAGVLTLTGTNTIGTINVLGGTVNANADAALGDVNGTINLNNGALQFGTAFTPAPTRAIVLGAGGGALDTAALTINLATTMTGPGSFAKLGLGTLNLNVPQSHLGGTVVAQGVLNNGIANALPTNGPLVVGNPLVNENTAVYALNGFDQTVASLSLVAKASGGPAARLVLGGNTLTVNGTLALIDNAGAPGNAFPVTVSSTAGGNINLGGAVRDLNVAGNNNASGDLLINAPITNGGINYTGTNSTTVAGIPARLSFGGTNTYAGGTTINSGTLIVTAAATLADPTGALTVNTTGPVGTNSLLTLNSSQTVGSLAGSVSGGGTATINFAAAGTLTVNQNINTTYAGVLSGASGALNKSGTGTLTLSGTNTYGGGTQVNAGRLNVNNTSGSGTGTGAVAVNGGTLGGTGSIGGAVTVNSGTLAPGLSPGILTINSNLTFTGGTFEVELQGLTPGTQYDQVVVTGTGNVNLGAGVANISVLPSGYTPALSDVFVVINNTGTGTLSGIFNGLPDQSVVASNVLGSGIDYLIWYGSYTGFSTSVVIAPIPEPATVLGICAVGFGAARMIRRRFKKTTTAA